MNLLLGYELGSGWQSSATWAIHSGLPYTPMAGYYDRIPIDPWTQPYDAVKPQPVTLWGDRNSSRLPAYHRLDLNLTRQFHVESALVTCGFSVINVYDRKNIFYFNRDTGEKVYMLRILPTVSLRVEL